MSFDPKLLHTGTYFEPGGFNCGGNSGYQAVNLCTLAGASRVILLGYDMAMTNGMSHWHGDHPEQFTNRPRASTYERWRAAFDMMAASGDLQKAGCEVVNATRETALTCFPRVRLEDVI